MPQRADLLAFPDDGGEVIRVATFSRSDLDFIDRRRGLANRLGVAVQLVYLRHLNKKLGVPEVPHAGVLRSVATQLRAPTSWDSYAACSASRREHLLELFERLRLTPFSLSHERAIIVQLLPVAMQTNHGFIVAQAAVAELRRRHVVLPPIGKLERLCAAAATRAQREIHRLLVDPLNTEHRRDLDTLLLRRTEGPLSTLAWLRRSPAAPNARAVLARIDRLQSIRDLNLPADIGRNIHPYRRRFRRSICARNPTGWRA